MFFFDLGIHLPLTDHNTNFKKNDLHYIRNQSYCDSNDLCFTNILQLPYNCDDNLRNRNFSEGSWNEKKNKLE